METRGSRHLTGHIYVITKIYSLNGEMISSPDCQVLVHLQQLQEHPDHLLLAVQIVGVLHLLELELHHQIVGRNESEVLLRGHFSWRRR